MNAPSQRRGLRPERSRLLQGDGDIVTRNFHFRYEYVEFQRLTAGHLQMEGTINDPKMYTRPWSFKVDFDAIPDGDLIEYVCENEKDAVHQVAK